MHEHRGATGFGGGPGRPAGCRGWRLLVGFCTWTTTSPRHPRISRHNPDSCEENCFWSLVLGSGVTLQLGPLKQFLTLYHDVDPILIFLASAPVGMKISAHGF